MLLLGNRSENIVLYTDCGVTCVYFYSGVGLGRVLLFLLGKGSGTFQFHSCVDRYRSS